MAKESHILSTDGWFIGEDKLLEYEVLQEDEATPQDVTGWAMSWALKRNDNASDPPIISKTTVSGITITGIFNAVRATNTQRVIITIIDTDTDALRAATYRYALKRTTEGFESILAYGNATLLKATTT
jgi:hypothetical protein